MFMQDRITQVEKHFGDLCDGFGSYARGFAKLRDKGRKTEQLNNI